MFNETDIQRDERMMRAALEEAQIAFDEGEIPIGAVISVNGRIIARAHNRTEALNDVTAHAEMQAITAASENLGGKYLPDCTLYVTVEPCPMCAGALGWSQIGRIVYGTSDQKKGFVSASPASMAADSRKAPYPLHPKTKISSGIHEEECREIMQKFFRKLRNKT